MIFKTNYENICHWNRWVSNFATSSWLRCSGCPKGVSMWMWWGKEKWWEGFLSFHVDVVGKGEVVRRIPESQRRPLLNLKPGASATCEQKIGEFPINQNRRVSKESLPALLFVFWSWHQRQGLIRCSFGSGQFILLHMVASPVWHKRKSPFFAVTPNFGHGE